MSTQRRSGTLGVVNTDDLSTMSDNELQYRMNRLHNEIQHGGSHDRIHHLETELAYCQREAGIRMKTYELHSEYLASLATQDADENITVHA